ncbi:MAG: hypothetical protein KY461_00530 [Actinobacteria bacterium]|nr:hypothetical protein [Actinomycetota bacterium]
MTSRPSTTSRRGRDVALRLCLVLATVLAGPMASAGSPAVSQERAPEDLPSARLVLTALSGTLGAGATPAAADDGPPRSMDLELRVLVENDGPTELADLRLFVEVFDQVRSRSVLREALDGDRVATGLLHVHDTLVRDGADVPAGDVAGVQVRIPAEDIGWSTTGGVHPVQVSVLRGSETLDRLVTAVVVVADEPTGALQTVVVWPVDATPWRGPEGVYPAGVDAEIQPGGRLDRILAAYERHPDASIHLLPAPHLLEDLQDRSDGFRRSVRGEDGPVVEDVPPDDPEAQRSAAFLERVRAAVDEASVSPLTGPYADHDIASTVAGPPELAEDAAIAAVEGRRRLQRLVGRAPDAATYVATTPLTRAALDVVPGEHLLLPWELVAGPDLDRDPDLPPALRTVTAASGRRFTATVADPRVSALVAGPDLDAGTLAATQRLVAETAMMFFQAPGTPGRPLLVYPPPGWSPGARVPGPLIDALVSAPWLDLVTPLVQLGGREAQPGLTFLPEAVSGLPGGITSELVHASQQLEAVRRALPEGESIDGRTYRQLSDQLLRAPSVWLRGGNIDLAAALVRDVAGAVDRTFGTVEIPSSANITLPSDTGNIPVTLQRPTGGPLRVCVEVESPGRLAWPDGERNCEVTLTGSSSQTVSFNTRALSRGQFPVLVRVTDPTGTRELGQATLVVRSTAISRPALVVTGIVVAGLLLVGALRRRRPPKRRRLEVVG